LYINASEAMPDGGLLRIGTDLVDIQDDLDKEKKIAKITIRDTGEGFSQTVLPHLFTPFFTTKEEGSGLGLATVKRIIDGLKGKVYGESHPEGGAEVTIFLQSTPDLSV
jgi:two-component system sensor histidine kinase PilS (NtrC family)